MSALGNSGNAGVAVDGVTSGGLIFDAIEQIRKDGTAI
jgi:hypothetical protein